MRLPRFSTARTRLLAAIWIAYFLDEGEAFGTTTTSQQRINHNSRNDAFKPLYNSLYGNSNDNNYDDNSSAPYSPSGYWHLPNDFSMFLTQRSVQSFMFLTRQLRDPETCYWVESFTKPNLVPQGGKMEYSLSEELPNLGKDVAASGHSMNNEQQQQQQSDDPQSKADKRTCTLLRYHGLAAMDTGIFPTWQHYFESMLEEPTDSWIISSPQKHIPDYTWEIDPLSLCSRILSVREQLSKEFANDLQAVSDMGGQTIEWYWERLKQSRLEEDHNTHDAGATHEENTPLIEPSSLKGSRENLLFLEINVDNPNLDHKPSPLRRGNFDLLVLLATEEAIHRVLNDWESKRQEGNLNGAEAASHAFLEDFYQERQQFFHGPLSTYGKADDLLEELLDSALVFKGESSSYDEPNADVSSGVVHPTKIAELVLKEREKVALDWMAIANEAPTEHMRIQALRLDKIMNPGGNNHNNAEEQGVFEAETNAHSEGYDPGPGAFE